jgi:nucleoside-diphosphate-sugar epimerase
LEAAAKCGVAKVIFASSGAATGFSFQKREIVPNYLPLDEEHPSNPQDDYGLSKLLGELICKRYTTAYDIRTLCLRINHAWYLDREGASISVQSGWAKGLTVEDLWARRYRKCILEPESDWPSPGPPRPRNLLWAVTDARDVAEAFRLAVDDQEITHEVFAINGSETCSLVHTPELIARYFPRTPLRASLSAYASLVSHQKASRLLGYQPRYSWRTGEFADWLRLHR